MAIDVSGDVNLAPLTGEPHTLAQWTTNFHLALVVRELQRSSMLNLTPVAFLDDDPAKQKQEISGIPVIGHISDLDAALDANRVDEVVIAMPSVPGTVVRAVAERIRESGVPSRTVPGVFELLDGQVSVSRLRPEKSQLRAPTIASHIRHASCWWRL